MTAPGDMSLPWIPANFLALPDHQSDLATASVVLIPIPCDSTTSVRSGARLGPASIIEASYGLEDYDWELDLDVSQLGIHTTHAVEPHTGDPAHMVERVKRVVTSYLSPQRLVGVVGGDHSVCIGSALAHRQANPEMSVLYLDAHADLHDNYLGTAWGHSSGARRISEHCPLTLAGIRSMAPDERDYLVAQGIPTYGWPPPEGETAFRYAEKIVAGLGPKVYISIDLDVLDPSLMAAVGTPEPGGMFWQDMMAILGALSRDRQIVGFDISELAPREGPPACAYTAAKLIYKIIGLAAAARSQPAN